MSYVKGLKCRECGREYRTGVVFVCEYCFGSLEIAYDYRKIKAVLSHKEISRRPGNIWRYRELLPLDKAPTDGLHTGWTPLVRARNLGKVLGLDELYIKDDSVDHPTL
ncbi:MAG: threonine synthase, partial [Candidatus Omnitrophota bacterium]